MTIDNTLVIRKIASLHNEGNKFFQNCEYLKARRCYETALENTINSKVQYTKYPLAFNLALTYFRLEKLEKAKSFFEYCMKKDPYDCLAMFCIEVSESIINDSKADFDRSIACMQRCPNHNYADFKKVKLDEKIENVDYKPLGLDFKIELDMLENKNNLENLMKLDFLTVFEVRDVFKLGLQDRSYINKHQTLFKGDEEEYKRSSEPKQHKTVAKKIKRITKFTKPSRLVVSNPDFK